MKSEGIRTIRTLRKLYLTRAPTCAKARASLDGGRELSEKTEQRIGIPQKSMFYRSTKGNWAALEDRNQLEPRGILPNCLFMLDAVQGELACAEKKMTYTKSARRSGIVGF